jgi:pyruvate-ferredoxin/flavodoxin oxidoreductase
MVVSSLRVHLLRERIKRDMPSFRDTILRLYRQLVSANAQPGTLAAGSEIFLDGSSAIAVCEAAITGIATTSGSQFSITSEVAWRSEQARLGRTLLGGRLQNLGTEGPRGAMAAAMGLTLAGERATLFVSGADLGAMPDLLTAAVERHLPLVVHMTTQDQNQTLSGGDDTISLVAQSGATTLIAESVQQAVDFTLIARRVAESTLTPVVVIIDSQQTAFSGQNVTLPTLELVDRFVGRDGDEVAVSDGAQQMIFGERRRRVPRWHDLDHPVMHGALHNGDTMGLLAASRELFFGQHIEMALNAALEEFHRLCGRHYATLAAHGSSSGDTLIIAQGSAMQQLKALPSELKKLKIALVGIYARQPINRAELVKLIAGKRHVVVLEQQSRSSRNSPLYNEIRALLDVANAAHATRTPTKLTSAIYGLGGMPLLRRDIARLMSVLSTGELGKTDLAKRYLGLSLTHGSSRHPKRQVLLDTLRREFPQLAALGLTADSTYNSKESATTITIALYRGTQSVDGQLINEIGSLIQQSGGSYHRTIESYPELKWQAWGNQLTDRLHFRESEDKNGPAAVMADAESSVDLAIVTEQLGVQEALAQLSSRGVVLLDTAITIDSALFQSYPHIKIYRVAAAEGEAHGTPRELLLGTIFGLLTQQEWLNAKLRPIVAAREAHFVTVTAAEILSCRDSFKQGFDHLNLITVADGADSASSMKVAIPLAVRHISGHDKGTQRYDSLPRFWDQVGLPYQNSERDELSADPYLATNTIPALTSTFNSYSKFNLQLPVFVENNCTGCGRCWGSCPDSAIGVAAITPKQFIERAITSVKADALRPLAPKIAARMTAQAKAWQKDSDSTALTMGELLAPAVTWVCDKGAIEGERLASINEATERATTKLGAIQIAVTDTLFSAGEAAQKDGGTLLALAINPDACKGCGLCIARCDDDALLPSAEMADRISAQAQWQIWEQLPDTDSTTIKRVAASSMDPVAARMLSRYCAFPMAGGDSAEPASGAKIALRMALATLEYHQQPLVARFSERVSGVHQQINERIRQMLTDALPTEDLSQLSESLAAVENRHIDLAQLNSVLEQSHEKHKIDATRLKRLLEIANALGDLHWRLTEGEQGLGRSRYSLVTAPGLNNSWAATYPYNPFQVPTLVENGGDAPQVAAGLIYGQVRKANEAIALLRWADSELKKSSSKASEQMEIPKWSDLSDDERAVAPPLILFGEAQEFGGRSLSQLLWLFKSELPVKVIVVSDLNFGLDSYGYHGVDVASTHQASHDLSMVALFQGRAYVAQSAISAPAHLNRVIDEALKYSGPALVQIHAPSPQRHGFPMSDTLLQAQRAVDARANPLFSANPLAQGVFGSRITLEGNRDIEHPWLAVDESTTEGHGDITRWSEWLLHESRFNHWLRPLSSEDPAAVKLVDYLELDSAARAKKCAIIEVAGERRFIEPEMVTVIEQCHRRWRMLQELAGVVTPFTAQVRAKAEAEIAGQHQSEMEQLRHNYEQQLTDLQQNFKAETAQRLRESLMTIAGYNVDAVSSSDNSVER